MSKGLLFFGAIAIAVLCTASAQADRWFPFNNFAGFRKDGFQFENEKGQMDVSYQAFRTSVSGGVARQQAGRTTGDNAYGAWAQTNGSIVVANSFIRGKGRYGTNASNQYVWGGFWTLYNKAKEKKLNWHYLEHDIMETFPDGSFFNRYIATNYKTNKVFIGNGLRQINGVRWWRNNWRNYEVRIFNNRAVFKSGGTSRTVQTGVRVFNQKILLTNRPWGSNISDVPANSRIADLLVDQIWLDTP